MGEFKKAREEFEHEITRSADEVKRDKDTTEKSAQVKPAANNESHDA
jgi:Sec-independent protein translocase protein TatA